MNNSKKPCDLKKCRIIYSPRKEGQAFTPSRTYRTKDSGFGFPNFASLGPGDRHT